MPLGVIGRILTSKDRFVTPTLLAHWRLGDYKYFDGSNMDDRLYYATRGLYLYVDAYGYKNGLSGLMAEPGASGLTLMQYIMGDDFESASQRIQLLVQAHNP